MRVLALLFTVLFLASPAHAQNEMRLFNWSNYIPPDLLKRFTAETGIAVLLDTYDSNDTMMAKLQAGGTGYDVVVPTGPTLAIMIGQGMLAEVNAPALPNYKNVREIFRNVPYDPGRRYSVPYLYGYTGIGYDPAFANGETLTNSWKEIFEPRPGYRGKLAMLNDAGENWYAAAFYLKLDACTEKAADAQAIYDLLARQKEYVLVYSSSATVDRMASGEAAMHQQWNGGFFRAANRKKTLQYLTPMEGMNLWGESLVIPKTAPNPANARRFLDFMMDPKSAAEASNFAGYGNAIEGSAEFMRDDLKASPIVNPPADILAAFKPSPICSAASRDLRDRVWTRLRR